MSSTPHLSPAQDFCQAAEQRNAALKSRPAASAPTKAAVQLHLGPGEAAWQAQHSPSNNSIMRKAVLQLYLGSSQDFGQEAEQRDPHNGRHVQAVEGRHHLARRLQQRLCKWRQRMGAAAQIQRQGARFKVANSWPNSWHRARAVTGGFTRRQVPSAPTCKLPAP